MNSSVYLVQLDCVWENKEASFARVRNLLSRSEPLPGSLVVLPEMFATGFSTNTAVTKQGASLETEAFLRSLAVQYQCVVVGGLVTERTAKQCHNETVVIDDTGVEKARYAKMRPFTLGGESAVHQAGSKVITFTWESLKIAPLICYDLRFPEISREAVLQHDAEMLIYISSWPIKRYQHWLTLLQARAIENQAYVVGVNRCGSDPEFTYPGRSVVVDPLGVIIADAGAQERVVRAEIDVKLLRDWRADFPALKDAKR